MIRGHKQGFPISATTRNRGGKQYALDTKENWYLCPWTSTILEQTGQSYSSLRAQAPSGGPHSPDPSQNENIAFAIALVLLAGRLLPWQWGDWPWQADTQTSTEKLVKQPVQTSSQLLPFGSWSLEFSSCLLPPTKCCYVDKASCAVCVVRLQWKYSGLNSTSYFMLQVP